ncbi:hypothetical protein [Streptomyces cyanogenus]|uniref:Secreted protein n=1 Tax=Streptomyces cyanogenus TaxID=80860 RepID=A0ABX7U5W3_STRCY|nr:hypothetical protein [Streptomyces cyanogenus]QTE02946.1 hypothetical protein S1361_36770 [Streptomyces cyanogenus]
MLRAPWRHLIVSALAWLGVVAVTATPFAAAGAPARAGVPVTAPGSPCAWPAVVRPGRLNFAFPETNATYWLTPYQLNKGDRLVVDGTYPSARFTALTAYDRKGAPIDALADYQISPSAGSKNPFAVPDAGTDPAHHRYQVTVKPGVAAGSGADTIAATTNSAASGAGFLVLRIYVPDNESSLAGGVPLPTLSIERQGSSPSAMKTCPRADSPQGPSGPLADTLRKLVKDNAPAGKFAGCGTFTTSDPGFASPTKVLGLFPNPYNKYLCAPLAYESGRIAVVRGKAPTFPNTVNNQSVLTKTQLRYWSLCQNQWQLPYPVSSCAADFQTALDKDGRYTYVVSTRQDRPANATTEKGVTWIDWGPTNVSSVLFFRNMLPADDFPNAIQGVKKGDDPAKVMGDYYPTVTYCAKEAFAKGGPDACAG